MILQYHPALGRRSILKRVGDKKRGWDMISERDEEEDSLSIRESRGRQVALDFDL